MAEAWRSSKQLAKSDSEPHWRVQKSPPSHRFNSSAPVVNWSVKPWRGCWERNKTLPMTDIIHLGLLVAFFVLSGLYANGCETL